MHSFCKFEVNKAVLDTKVFIVPKSKLFIDAEELLLFDPSRLPRHVSPILTKMQHHETMIKVIEANS